MKTFICLILLVLGLTAVAEELPRERRPCSLGRSSCIDFKGLSTIFGPGGAVLNKVGVTQNIYPGIYYQRATASTCSEAFERAQEKLLFNHPEFRCDGNFDGKREEIYCGATNMGPKLKGNSCMRSSRGEIVAWIVCDNSDHGKRRPPADNSATGYVLLESLKRQEREIRGRK